MSIQTTDESNVFAVMKSDAELKSAPAHCSAPLTPRQKEALEKIGPEWTQCPLYIRSCTLLSLRERGLIESRVSKGFESSFYLFSYNGLAFEWRQLNAELSSAKGDQ